MRGISKTFAGTQVLRDVDLALHGGEIHALMGENGAGKSTLMKILSGALRADPGSEIRLLGRRVVIDGPRRARALGFKTEASFDEIIRAHIEDELGGKIAA